MSNIEAEDTEGFFDINIDLTGTQNKSDIKSSALLRAMDILHTHTAVDLMTGRKTTTQLGRPDWKPIFAQIKEAHPSEKIDVYFCGAPGLSKVLKKLSSEHQFHYHKENF
jgi:respiratory burst oxidase